MAPKRIKALIYYRVSKKGRNDVRMQRKICKDFCLKQNIKNFKEFIDKGVSGTTRNRPALNSLLGYIEENDVNCVMVYKLDRLGRSFSHLNELMDFFDSHNVRLISATQNLDNSTPEGKFMLRLLMGLAEFESGMISKRTIDGLRAML